MVNRTALSLDIGEYPDYIALQLQTGQLKRAFLGNANGVIPVATNQISSDHYGKVYIRFIDGLNDSGATVLGQAVEAWVNPNANYTYKTNLPVLVRTIGANNGYMVEQVDVIACARANYNTHVLNPMSPENQRFWLRQVWDAGAFALGTINNDSLTVSVSPFIFHWDGAYYDGGQPDNIDLSSYMPAADLERLVLLGIRAYDRTVQIVQSGTRTITHTKYALSDIANLIDEFDDYIIPIQAVKLADNAVTVLERDLHQDLRQFINIQPPRGTPTSIVRHTLILNGFQDSAIGGIEISGIGSLEIQTGGSFIIL
jgi:hypothetical protein